jgi:hypothetical protein
MEKQSIKYFGQQSTEKNIEIIRKLLPKKSVIVHFEGNPYFKEFLSHFFTANNLEFVQELVYKLAEFRIAENDSNAHQDIYNDSNFYIKRSFFISAIITYSRIFNSPKSKIKKLDIKHLVKEISEDLILDEISMRDRLLTIHEKIITLRNKYVAHAEDTHFETINAFMSFQFNGKVLEHSLQGVYLGTYNFDGEETQDWIMLNSFLIKKLKEKQGELMDLFFNNLNREELLKLAAEAGAFNKD